MTTKTKRDQYFHIFLNHHIYNHKPQPAIDLQTVFMMYVCMYVCIHIIYGKIHVYEENDCYYYCTTVNGQFKYTSLVKFAAKYIILSVCNRHLLQKKNKKMTR